MRTMYDSVNASKIPAGAQLVAGYVDGKYLWSPSDWSSWAAVPQVRIAVFASTNDGNCADVENGDMTPASCVDWVLMRRAAGADPSVYCSASPWPQVRAAFQARGVAEPHYWIADWNNDQAVPDGAVAHQWTNGPAYDTSSVAAYWPGVDPVAPPPTPSPTPPDPSVAIVRAIIDTYLATELGQGPSAQALIKAILDRIEAAATALDLHNPPPA